MLQLDGSVSQIKGVGKAYQAKLAKLGLKSIRDLVYYFPFRYLDFSEISLIKNLKLHQVWVIKGKIISLKTRCIYQRKITITEGLVKDQTGSIKVVWFNQPYLEQSLAHRTVLLAGRIELRNNQPIMVSPQFELEKSDQVHVGTIAAIYCQTKGLSSKWLRTKLRICQGLIDKFPDFLPQETARTFKLIGLGQALSWIHFPKNRVQLSRAKKRLAFDELFLLALKSQQLRVRIKKFSAPKLSFQEKKTKKFIKNLSFSLTNDQKKAAWQIIQDLTTKKPMNRLLNGDVGSGKTIVAALGVLNVVLSGWRASLMVPTEILAEQHFQAFKNFFRGFGIRIDLYTADKKTIDLVGSNKPPAGLVVGTQALIQDKVKISKLGLVIIDEQHRFGVEQRRKMAGKRKGNSIPHLLSLTATPIPRSLALGLYGDLDISFIKESPKNRKKVITKTITPKRRKEVYKFIDHEIKKGRQVFVVCPLIERKEQSETKGQLEKRSVKREYQKLKTEIFRQRRVKCLHGQMKKMQKKSDYGRF